MPFDLQENPDEFNNLADNPAYQHIVIEYASKLLGRRAEKNAPLLTDYHLNHQMRLEQGLRSGQLEPVFFSFCEARCSRIGQAVGAFPTCSRAAFSVRASAWRQATKWPVVFFPQSWGHALKLHIDSAYENTAICRPVWTQAFSR